jgi:hypothetical protein
MLCGTTRFNITLLFKAMSGASFSLPGLLDMWEATLSPGGLGTTGPGATRGRRHAQSPLRG